MMDDRTKLRMAIIAENAVTTICFTFLALVFGKWWIVLLAVFFYTREKEVK